MEEWVLVDRLVGLKNRLSEVFNTSIYKFSLMKKIATVLVLSLILGGIASALSAEIEPVQRETEKENPAQFRLSVTNNYSENTTFQMSSVRVPSKLRGIINYPRYMEVGSGETKDFLINISHPENTVEGNYQFVLTVRSYKHGEAVKVDDYFVVRTEKDLSIISYDISRKKIKPGDEVESSITFKNTATRPLKNLSVRAEFFNQSSVKKGYELPSGAKLSHEFSLKAPKNASPGEREFKMIVESDKQRKEVVQKVEVEEVRNISEDRVTSNYLLYSTEEVSITNYGNSMVTEKVNVTAPSYLDALIEFDTEPDSMRTADGQNIYSWEVELNPGESAEFDYRIRYWIPLILLAGIIAAFWVFRKLRSPVKISKKVSRDGEKAKIELEIENSSSHNVENIVVKDYVPDITSVDKEFEMASPVVRKKKDQTELEWEIGSMKPGEKRLLGYEVNPAIKIDGEVEFPAAELQKEGAKMKKSGKVKVNFNPEK